MQTWVNPGITALTNTTLWSALVNENATNRFEILIIANQAHTHNNSSVFNEAILKRKKKKIQKMPYYVTFWGIMTWAKHVGVWLDLPW